MGTGSCSSIRAYSSGVTRRCSRARRSAATSADVTRSSIEFVELLSEPMVFEITLDFAPVHSGEPQERLDVGHFLEHAGGIVLQREHFHRREMLRPRYRGIHARQDGD